MPLLVMTLAWLTRWATLQKEHKDLKRSSSRSTDQKACKFLPNFHALKAPSPNFRAMRHMPDALKADEGAGEISGRHTKNGNSMALLKMSLGGVCCWVWIFLGHPKNSASAMKNQPFFMRCGTQSWFGRCDARACDPHASQKPQLSALGHYPVIPFHVFRLTPAAVRRASV